MRYAHTSVVYIPQFRNKFTALDLKRYSCADESEILPDFHLQFTFVCATSHSRMAKKNKIDIRLGLILSFALWEILLILCDLHNS